MKILTTVTVVLLLLWIIILESLGECKGAWERVGAAECEWWQV